MKEAKAFAWKPFLRALAAIAIPVALQNLLTTTGSMIDTMMVAPLGQNTVGALGLCAQFSSLMFSCYWGFVGGGMLFIAQYWGAGDERGIERSYGMTLTCLMTVAFTFAALAMAFPELIMRIYTDKEALRSIGVQYLRIIGLAYIFQVFSMAMSVLLRSTEHVVIPFAASIVSVGSNIFLNWVFIYGHLGAPALGFRGAAIATVCAGAINVLLILLLSLAVRYPFLFRFRGHFRWDGEFIATFFRKCFPIICNELLVGIGFMVINITLGRQPEDIIAAVAVFRTIEGLVIGFFAGFSNAASILVGTCVGAGEPRKAYERAKRLVYLCSFVIASAELLIYLFRNPLLHRMSLSGSSYRAGEVLLLIYFIAAVIRMGNWIQNDTYRAAGDAVYGTVLEITFMYVMVIPAMLISAFLLHAPYWVVFLCCYIDEPIRYILMQRHLYSARWIKPVTKQGQDALYVFLEERRHGSETVE